MAFIAYYHRRHFALQPKSTLSEPPAARSDILSANHQKADIPVLARPEPELEDLIDDELGLQPPVIDGLGSTRVRRWSRGRNT